MSGSKSSMRRIEPQSRRNKASGRRKQPHLRNNRKGILVTIRENKLQYEWQGWDVIGENRTKITCIS